MTKLEAAQIIALMQANYPDEFRSMSDDAMKARVNLWAAMFQDDDFQSVKMAVVGHMASDTSRFMPPVGVIKNMLVKMSSPEQMTEQEAWTCVMQALRNSSYNSAEEFAKLPPVVQRLVGSASQLREWAMMDTETINSVVASNFQRSYKVRAKSERETAALPATVRSYMQQLVGGMSMDAPALEGKSTAPALEAPADDPKARETMHLINRYRAEINDAQYDMLCRQVESGDHAGAISGLQSVLQRHAAPRAITELIPGMEGRAG